MDIVCTVFSVGCPDTLPSGSRISAPVSRNGLSCYPEHSPGREQSLTSLAHTLRTHQASCKYKGMWERNYDTPIGVSCARRYLPSLPDRVQVRLEVS